MERTVDSTTPDLAGLLRELHRIQYSVSGVNNIRTNVTSLELDTETSPFSLVLRVQEPD